jgi:hypothetical protein
MQLEEEDIKSAAFILGRSFGDRNTSDLKELQCGSAALWVCTNLSADGLLNIDLSGSTSSSAKTCTCWSVQALQCPFSLVMVLQGAAERVV